MAKCRKPSKNKELQLSVESVVSVVSVPSGTQSTKSGKHYKKPISRTIPLTSASPTQYSTTASKYPVQMCPDYGPCTSAMFNNIGHFMRWMMLNEHRWKCYTLHVAPEGPYSASIQFWYKQGYRTCTPSK